MFIELSQRNIALLSERHVFCGAFYKHTALRSKAPHFNGWLASLQIEEVPEFLFLRAQVVLRVFRRLDLDRNPFDDL